MDSLRRRNAADYLSSDPSGQDNVPDHSSSPRRKRRRSMTRYAAAWLAASTFLLGRQYLRRRRPNNSMDETRGDTNKQEPTHPKITVGIAVTVTGCSKAFPLDGAAVLQYSLFRNNTFGRYEYAFYAIYHPTAFDCVAPLASLGFALLERDTPVNVSEIRGTELRERISGNGCCGEKELIKFEAFLLTEHPVVVLMDIDMIVLNPLDAILDLILESRRPTEDHHLMYPDRKIPDDIWLLYTNDYAMIVPGRSRKPTQGGFVVLKPNRTIYKEIVEIVLEGNYSRGWGGVTGKYWGSMTVQGLLPYYFQILHPGHAVELNWCRHDNMNAPPRENGVCYNQQPECEDCRTRQIDEVYSVHFTNCQKPFTCHLLNVVHPKPEKRLCQEMHLAWFQFRSEMERSWGRLGKGNGTGVYETNFRGYCHRYGEIGYEPIRQPYGSP